MEFMTNAAIENKRRVLNRWFNGGFAMFFVAFVALIWICIAGSPGSKHPIESIEMVVYGVAIFSGFTMIIFSSASLERLKWVPKQNMLSIADRVIRHKQIHEAFCRILTDRDSLTVDEYDFFNNWIDQAGVDEAWINKKAAVCKALYTSKGE